MNQFKSLMKLCQFASICSNQIDEPSEPVF